MRTMALLAVVLLAGAGGPDSAAAATITIYTDRNEWQNALGGRGYVEDFTDSVLSDGVSYVSTESGHINPTLECYQDVLASQSQNEPMTTWTFASAISGYGGSWTLGGPGGSGNSLLVTIADASLYVGFIPNSYGGDFWGFVSDTPFSSVRVVGGSGTNQQHYCLDDMVFGRADATGVNGGVAAAGAGSALSLWPVPNPSVGSTSIEMRSSASLSEVAVAIYDAAGRRVKDLAVGDLPAGVRDVLWDGRADDGRPVGAGVYYCTARHAGGSTTKRLVILR